MEEPIVNPKNEKHPEAANQPWREGRTDGRKREIVIRLLRGESLDVVSREIGVDFFRLER
jgi:hypothetical protein